MTDLNTHHKPVLLQTLLNIMEGRQIKTLIDGCLGAGGHSAAIIKEHPELHCLMGIDQDIRALNLAKKRLEDFKGKTHFVKGNFRHMAQYAKDNGVNSADAILLDIGVSSMQLDEAERGFSFSREGPLDMRMNQSQELTAKEIVNSWPESKLAQIFLEYGEEWRGHQAAKAICAARQKKKLVNTTDLAEVLKPVLFKTKKINPLTLIFQALRIAVNDELGALNEVLPQALALLAPGGCLYVISFHSLEDRMVKEFFKKSVPQSKRSQEVAAFKIVTKKALQASVVEQRENRRSRSAKLRVIEKIA